MSSKYIMVVGGVISGTGKGISAASLGLLLKMRGSAVQVAKFDPYLNLNAGTMNPRQHGEVFLCNDGTETDLDLGHYERITGLEVSAKNIWTSGVMYKEILDDEEEGKYLGQTVQIIPHVTDKIQARLKMLGEGADIVIVEIGGTVGDLESGPYYEAIRQFKQKQPDDVLLVLVAPILWVPTIKEHKTKPLQNAVKAMQSHGLQTDMLLCRVDGIVPDRTLDKVANLTNIPREAVFQAPDVSSIYQVPIEFYNRHIDDFVADRFHLRRNGVRIHKYRDLVEKYIHAEELPEIEIGIVGKYENCDEAYLSLKEAIYHAGVSNSARVKVRWISAEALESAKDFRGVWHHFNGLSGAIVPGGFDSRGVEGKIRAAGYCREKRIPYLGICLGLQCAVIEFARHIGMENATSTEFDPKTNTPVIHFVPGQEAIRKKCGTMRLGAYDCIVEKDTLARTLYKKRLIFERHRHRYEVNDEYVEKYAENGFYVSGRHPDTNLIEIMELDQEGHPFFIGTQAHPEFRSRLGSPNPLFDGLIAAAMEFSEKDDR